MSNKSIVVDIGGDSSSCGYCGSSTGFNIEGSLWAISLTTEHYQELIDRNWRRSGQFLYKPNLTQCCCPLYTIRLDVHKFQPNKKQKKTLKRLRRYLGFKPDNNVIFPQENRDNNNNNKNKINNSKKKNKKSKNSNNKSIIEKQLEDFLNECAGAVAQDMNVYEAFKFKKSVVQPSKKPKFGDLTSNAAFAVIGAVKRQKSNIHQHRQQHHQSSHPSPPPSLPALSQDIVDRFHRYYASQDREGFISRMEPTAKGNINIWLTDHGKSVLKEQKNTEPSPTTPITPPMSPMEDQHTLHIQMVPAQFTQESFELFKKYQINVHKDAPEDVTEDSFTNFLVKTPLKIEEPEESVEFDFDASEVLDLIPELEGLKEVSFGGFLGYGSFHIQYRIDGKLFMVGVVDILPRCLSSVYLYYDTDYSFLAPGIYSALAEILWVKCIARHLPSLRYYYMGYYIHSCPKMRYKAEYSPSDLLCPTTFRWVSFDAVRPLLDRIGGEGRPLSPVMLNFWKYVHDEEGEDDLGDDGALGNTVCVVSGNVIPYHMLRQVINLDEEIAAFRKLVGRKLGNELFYLLNQ
eukprot:gb/GECH01006922.1/.p1 GENE.gb/GECH01006922.1/~~gb/GECH01006922.1/.p1  ORF type:complete len:573 (+),score=153.54 gb/GECH01006922.1/:1-1719(+)